MPATARQPLNLEADDLREAMELDDPRSLRELIDYYREEIGKGRNRLADARKWADRDWVPAGVRFHSVPEEKRRLRHLYSVLRCLLRLHKLEPTP